MPSWNHMSSGESHGICLLNLPGQVTAISKHMASGGPARCQGIWTTTRNSLCKGDRWEAIALPPGALIGWWAIPYHQWVTSPDLWRSTILGSYPKSVISVRLAAGGGHSSDKWLQ